jgi:predicted RNase H-like HicB family nuclease
VRHYVGLIHKEKGSNFGVSFPDFPGVVTAACSMLEARKMAEEALAFHLEGLVQDGLAIPEPSSLETVMTNRHSSAIPVLIPLPHR